MNSLALIWVTYGKREHNSLLTNWNGTKYKGIFNSQAKGDRFESLCDHYSFKLLCCLLCPVISISLLYLYRCGLIPVILVSPAIHDQPWCWNGWWWCNKELWWQQHIKIRKSQKSLFSQWLKKGKHWNIENHADEISANLNYSVVAPKNTTCSSSYTSLLVSPSKNLVRCSLPKKLPIPNRPGVQWALMTSQTLVKQFLNTRESHEKRCLTTFYILGWKNICMRRDWQ